MVNKAVNFGGKSNALYISRNFKNYTFCLYNLHFCRNYQMLRQSFEHGGSKNVDISEKLNSFKDWLITTITGK